MCHFVSRVMACVIHIFCVKVTNSKSLFSRLDDAQAAQWRRTLLRFEDLRSKYHALCKDHDNVKDKLHYLSVAAIGFKPDKYLPVFEAENHDGRVEVAAIAIEKASSHLKFLEVARTNYLVKTLKKIRKQIYWRGVKDAFAKLAVIPRFPPMRRKQIVTWIGYQSIGQKFAWGFNLLNRFFEKRAVDDQYSAFTNIAKHAMLKSKSRYDRLKNYYKQQKDAYTLRVDFLSYNVRTIHDLHKYISEWRLAATRRRNLKNRVYANLNKRQLEHMDRAFQGWLWRTNAQSNKFKSTVQMARIVNRMLLNRKRRAFHRLDKYRHLLTEHFQDEYKNSTHSYYQALHLQTGRLLKIQRKALVMWKHYTHTRKITSTLSNVVTGYRNTVTRSFAKYVLNKWRIASLSNRSTRRSTHYLGVFNGMFMRDKRKQILIAWSQQATLAKRTERMLRNRYAFKLVQDHIRAWFKYTQRCEVLRLNTKVLLTLKENRDTTTKALVYTLWTDLIKMRKERANHANTLLMMHQRKNVRRCFQAWARDHLKGTRRIRRGVALMQHVINERRKWLKRDVIVSLKSKIMTAQFLQMSMEHKSFLQDFKRVTIHRRKEDGTRRFAGAFDHMIKGRKKVCFRQWIHAAHLSINKTRHRYFHIRRSKMISEKLFVDKAKCYLSLVLRNWQKQAIRQKLLLAMIDKNRIKIRAIRREDQWQSVDLVKSLFAEWRRRTDLLRERRIEAMQVAHFKHNTYLKTIAFGAFRDIFNRLAMFKSKIYYAIFFVRKRRRNNLRRVFQAFAERAQIQMEQMEIVRKQELQIHKDLYHDVLVSWFEETKRQKWKRRVDRKCRQIRQQLSIHDKRQVFSSWRLLAENRHCSEQSNHKTNWLVGRACESMALVSSTFYGWKEIMVHGSHNYIHFRDWREFDRLRSLRMHIRAWMEYSREVNRKRKREIYTLRLCRELAIRVLKREHTEILRAWRDYTTLQQCRFVRYKCSSILQMKHLENNGRVLIAGWYDVVHNLKMRRKKAHKMYRKFQEDVARKICDRWITYVRQRKWQLLLAKHIIEKVKLRNLDFLSHVAKAWRERVRVVQDCRVEAERKRFYYDFHFIKYVFNGWLARVEYKRAVAAGVGIIERLVQHRKFNYALSSLHKWHDQCHKITEGEMERDKKVQKYASRVVGALSSSKESNMFNGLMHLRKWQHVVQVQKLYRQKQVLSSQVGIDKALRIQAIAFFNWRQRTKEKIHDKVVMRMQRHFFQKLGMFGTVYVRQFFTNWRIFMLKRKNERRAAQMLMNTLHSIHQKKMQYLFTYFSELVSAHTPPPSFHNFMIIFMLFVIEVFESLSNSKSA